MPRRLVCGGVHVSFSGRASQAGFLARLAALLIDLAAVLIATQILTATAYHLSNGQAQGALGVATTYCEPISQLPHLQPEPPSGINFALKCERTFMGLELASFIELGKAIQTGERSIERTAYRYALSPAGEQVVPAIILQTTHAVVLLILYLALTDWLTGASLGKAILRLRTVDLAATSERGISLGKVFLRHISMQAGLLIFLIFLLVSGQATTSGASAVGPAHSLFWPLVGGWIFWNAARLLIKSEPLYDLAAGTTVVRRA